MDGNWRNWCIKNVILHFLSDNRKHKQHQIMKKILHVVTVPTKPNYVSTFRYKYHWLFAITLRKMIVQLFDYLLKYRICSKFNSQYCRGQNTTKRSLWNKYNYKPSLYILNVKMQPTIYKKILIFSTIWHQK